MELLHEVTCCEPPQTPHERWFLDTYKSIIERALHKLRQPLDLRSSAHAQHHPSSQSSGGGANHSSTIAAVHHAASTAAWSGFKQLQHSLSTRAAKRSALVLSMKDMSPGNDTCLFSIV